MNRIAAWLLALCTLFGGNVLAQSYFAVADHAFQGPEGSQPQAVVAALDGSVYGVAAGGGTGFGTLFRYTSDGTVTPLHDFNGSDGSMKFPSCCSHGALAKLVLAPSGDLYGYTLTGGNANCQSGFGCGVVFRYSPTNGFTVLWKFTGAADGSTPSGLLLAADGFLYGTTYGLPDNNGAVFKLSTSGSMTVLHAFCTAPNCTDGLAPEGLAQGPDHNFYGHYSSPDYIYRITPAGVITPLVSLNPNIGNNYGAGAGNFLTGGDGAIYFTFDRDQYGSGRVDRYDINNHRLTLVHQFDYTDGDPPYGLALGTDGSIYGTAGGGGKQGIGAAFRVVSPNSLTFLYDFQGALDGTTPTGLTQTSDGRLFGVAAQGGVAPAGSACSGCGTFYQLAPVVPAAPIITSFDPASGPLGTPVTVTGSQFTGTVALSFGGAPGGFNVQSDKSLSTNVPSGIPALAQLAISNAAGTGYLAEPFEASAYRYSAVYRFCPGVAYPTCRDGAGPDGLIQSSNGNFYGTTSFNGPSSVLFKVTAAGAESVLASNLNLPNAIVESGDYFYGTSHYGGYYGLATGCNNPENPTGCGTVFRVNRNTGASQILYKFKGQADGSFPRTNMVAIGGNSFYGTTPGTLFLYRPTGLKTAHAFNAATDGNAPALLIAGQDGNVYGVNTAGGTANLGTVFKYSPATSTFQLLHSFAATEGGVPVSLIRTTDGTLYGATQAGGANGHGTVFRIDAAGVYTTIYSFPDAAGLGASPETIALGADGALYGFTVSGAALSGGALWRMATNGSNASVLYSFFPSGSASTHGYAPTSLLQAQNGNWYGTTASGGATSCAYGEGCGMVFHLH